MNWTELFNFETAAEVTFTLEQRYDRSDEMYEIRWTRQAEYTKMVVNQWQSEEKVEV